MLKVDWEKYLAISTHFSKKENTEYFLVVEKPHINIHRIMLLFKNATNKREKKKETIEKNAILNTFLSKSYIYITFSLFISGTLDEKMSYPVLF